MNVKIIRKMFYWVFWCSRLESQIGKLSIVYKDRNVERKIQRMWHEERYTKNMRTQVSFVGHFWKNFGSVHLDVFSVQFISAPLMRSSRRDQLIKRWVSEFLLVFHIYVITSQWCDIPVKENIFQWKTRRNLFHEKWYDPSCKQPWGIFPLLIYNKHTLTGWLLF